MAGETQITATNPELTARFVKKRYAKKLDKYTEKYVSLMEEAQAYDMKADSAKKAKKSEKYAAKADKLMSKAEEWEAKYSEKADTLNVRNTFDEQVAEKEVSSLVPDDIKLSKSQKKEVEKLEKELESAQKALNKYTQKEIVTAARTEESARTSRQKGAVAASQKVDELTAEYNALRNKYGIPSEMDIIEQLYAIPDPEKASKLRDKIKAELKDANMYFGNTKEFLKSDYLENVSEAEAIRKRVVNNLDKGYVGAKKSVVKAFQDKDAADVAIALKEAAGYDMVFNRRSNERTIAALSQNVDCFGDDYIDANKDKTFGELDGSITVGGKTIDIKDIKRVTLLSGAYIAVDDYPELIEDVKLGTVMKIEDKSGKTYDFQPVYNENKKDGKISRLNTKRAGKALGYEYDPINVKQTVIDTAALGLGTLATAALSTFKAAFDSGEISLKITAGDGTFTSEMIDEIINQITEEAAANGYSYNLSTDATELEIIRHRTFETEHFCAAPVIAAAAIAFIGGMLHAAGKSEKECLEAAYNAAVAKLTLEQKTNAAGGSGRVLNQKELDAAMAQVMLYAKHLMETYTPPAKEESVVEEVQTPTVKEAVITKEDIDPQMEEAEYCVYNNVSGEYWYGIVESVYRDENGNPITSRRDIAELTQYIKQTVNGYKASDFGMPKGVKLKKSYTCKSGKTYTYGCEEPAKRNISNALPKDKTAADVRMGKPRIDLSAGTVDRMLKDGSYSYSWKDKNDPVNFGSQTFTSFDERNTAMEAERKALEEKGYTVE